jgi:dienelactone hydrolase
MPTLLFAVLCITAADHVDNRLGKPRDLNGYFPMAVPASKEAWEIRRRQLREQVLVATGLWPMPPRPPIQANLNGRIDRDDYTIERVYFQSLPGHYVTGNLYRPKEKRDSYAAVLCPHGHWRDGRFQDELKGRNEDYLRKQVDSGGEQTIEGARYPLQARCAQLAVMGCIVFHYDMVGYADSKAIPHRTGFTDVQAELHGQNFMGLQTFNSIRALDFLLSLPEVDAARIGVTGASGGGTQTFILCAIDDRPAAAFPAVMVSTAMQGGCICENCSHLRVRAGNIDLAALFAPKPLAMTGANDWTIDIETKGLPELKAVYRLYGAEDRVDAKCFPKFDHNYNQVSRELMYTWFNKHLRLGHAAPIREQPFVPVSPTELAVFDSSRPAPKDASSAQALRQTLTALAEEHRQKTKPSDRASFEAFRKEIGTALRVMVHDSLPPPSDIEAETSEKPTTDNGVAWKPAILKRRGSNERIPITLIEKPGSNGTVYVWIHPDGKRSVRTDGELTPFARRLIDSGGAILAPDVFGVGELKPATPAPVDGNYAGFTFGYNRTPLANRVHDILTCVAYARNDPKVNTVHLIGFGNAGPWVIIARALCGDAVERTVADVNRFRFDAIQTTADEMILPGALKYGGLPAFAALCAPGELFLYNHRGTGVGGTVKEIYRLVGASGHFRHESDETATPEAIADWLLAKPALKTDKP